MAFVNGLQQACWYRRGHSHSPLQAEATALLVPARAARIKNWTSVLFLSDCADLISLVNSKSSHSWDCKYIIHDFFLKILLVGFANGIVNRLAG